MRSKTTTLIAVAMTAATFTMPLTTSAHAGVAGSAISGSQAVTVESNVIKTQASKGGRNLKNGFGSGREQLRRLMRNHVGFVPITQEALNATGDPNIIVIDRRVGGVNRCSFSTIRRGQRALICD
ncbi:MAG: hypothetical protein AAGF28_12895 [Pseudomonadota bacterium]